MQHDSFIRVVCLIHTCDVTHHDTKLSQSLAPAITPSYAWHDTFHKLTWLIHTWGMSHSYMWHDASRNRAVSISGPYHHSSICVTFHLCDMTQSNICDMTHSYNVTWLIRKLSGHNHWLRSHGTYSYIRLTPPPPPSPRTPSGHTSHHPSLPHDHVTSSPPLSKISADLLPVIFFSRGLFLLSRKLSWSVLALKPSVCLRWQTQTVCLSLSLVPSPLSPPTPSCFGRLDFALKLNLSQWFSWCYFQCVRVHI